MSFNLKDAPASFSRLVVPTIKDFIHKFLFIYMDDWTIYGIVKYHTVNLCLMLERCRQHHISLNVKKCIFFAPFGIILGHIVCKDIMLVDPSKITVIIDLSTPTTVKQLRVTVVHTGYY